MQIDFLGIQAFLAIIECGSFQQAAAQLNISQTAVSHRLRKLEEQLGVRLLARTTREVSLTEAGRALLPRARSAVQELDASCETVRKHGQNANNWLAFACLPTLAATTLPGLLADCHIRWPDLPVRVFDSNIHEILELVESRVASFGISVMPAPRGNLAAEPIGREPFVLLCPEGHALAGRAQVGWPELKGEPLVRISMSSGNSMTIDDTLGPLRDTLRWRFEAQHTAMAIEMVRGGLALTVVPMLAVAARPGGPAVHGLRAVRLAAPEVWRALGVVTRRDVVATAQEAFLRDGAVAHIRSAITPPP